MNQEKIGKFIAFLRKEKKLTQFELAEKLGVTEKSVGNWENGRNMPDLSLFKPLCDILDISMNDLMSGEKVDDNNYLNTLEENLVNIVVDVKKKKKKRNIVIISILLVTILLLFISKLFYELYEIDVKYDNRVMKCNISGKELKFIIKGQSVFNTYFISKKLDNKEIYFFHTTINIYNKRKSHWEYSESMARLLENKDVTFSSSNILDINNDDVEVYYTDYSINQIEKASNNELEKIIKKSYLMCSSNE